MDTSDPNNTIPQNQAQPESIQPTTQSSVQPGVNKKVLCIEDERFIGELYGRALEKAGYSVNIVPDGQLGLQEALTNSYDIILLDIMIPQVLGIDILEKLRKQRPDLKAKIIIATNLEQDDAIRANIEKSADGYLIKAEITPRELVEFLNQF